MARGEDRVDTRDRADARQLVERNWMRVKRHVLTFSASLLVLVLTLAIVPTGLVQTVQAAMNDGGGTVAVMQQTPTASPTTGTGASPPTSPTVAPTSSPTSTALPPAASP